MGGKFDWKFVFAGEEANEVAGKLGLEEVYVEVVEGVVVEGKLLDVVKLVVGVLYDVKLLGCTLLEVDGPWYELANEMNVVCEAGFVSWAETGA